MPMGPAPMMAMSLESIEGNHMVGAVRGERGNTDWGGFWCSCWASGFDLPAGSQYSASNPLDDLIFGLSLQLVLPDTNDFPASPPQSTKVALVSSTVGAEFVSPESRQLVFPTGQPPAVPEIPINEHSDLLFRKDDIWAAREQPIV